MKETLISVITPVFNRSHIIGETLDSLIAQSYTHWECIIVDDGSTDETAAVVGEYVNRDNRFKFFKRPHDRNKGASPCRNIGIERSTGDLIQFLDSDDLLEKTKFEEQLKLLHQSPPLTLVTCKWGSFSSSSSVRVKTRYYSYRNFKPGVELLYNFGKHDEYFPPLVYLVPRKLIDKAGKWDETIPINPNDDGEYFTRVLKHTDRVTFCESTSGYYRAGNTGRLSLLDNSQKINGVIASWKMIEEQLKPNFRKVAEKYVHNGKRNVYDQIKESHPLIVEEHRDFFQEFIRPKNWLKRMISR